MIDIVTPKRTTDGDFFTTDYTDIHGWGKGEGECFFEKQLSVPIREIRG